MANMLPVQIGLKIAAEVLGDSSSTAKDDRGQVDKDKASGAADAQSFASLLQGSLARKAQPKGVPTAAKGYGGPEGPLAADLLKGKAKTLAAEMKQLKKADPAYQEMSQKKLESLAKKALAGTESELNGSQAVSSKGKILRSGKNSILAQAAAEGATVKDIARQARLRSLKGQETDSSASAATSKQASRKMKGQSKTGAEAQKTAGQEAAAEEKVKVETGSADKVKADAGALKVKEPEKAEVAVSGKGNPVTKASEAAEGSRAQMTFSTLAADGKKAPAPATPVRAALVLQQIIENAGAALRQGSGRVVITLHPPRLGSLDMDIVVRDNCVKMIMLADSREVKEVLEAKMGELKTSLQEQGFQVDRLEVAVQDQSEKGDNGFWREFRLAEQEKSSAGGGQGGEGDEAGRESLRPAGRRSFDEDEWRRISIFA